MNRSHAESILAAVSRGKRIAVISAPGRVQESFAAVEDVAVGDRVMSFRRSNGRELIRHPSGGRVAFFSTRSSRRGMELDAVFVEADAGLTPERLQEIMPALVARGGVVIRA